MNHSSRAFKSPDGRCSHASHSWELREGGYRRLALLFGYPLWPVKTEERLVRFLIGRGFRVEALDLGSGSAESPGPSLARRRAAVEAFAASRAELGLPVYALASSFAVPIAAPALQKLPELSAVGLVAPVLEYPPPGLRKPRCFLSAFHELAVGAESLSGQPELLPEELRLEPVALRFHRRDLSALVSEAAQAASSLGPLASRLPVAAFLGEEDPFASASLRTALAQAGVKVHAYPRVRHAPAFDRYADNFFADLGAFLDGVEAGRARA